MIPLLKIKTDEGAWATKVHACVQIMRSCVYAYACHSNLQTAVAVNLRMRTVHCVCGNLSATHTSHHKENKV